MENISPRSHRDLESYKHHGEISVKLLLGLTHAHVQNRWQQTNSSILQKQNNPEQSLIEIYYKHLSYSLKLPVKKCIIEYYIKQPDIC